MNMMWGEILQHLAAENQIYSVGVTHGRRVLIFKQIQKRKPNHLFGARENLKVPIFISTEVVIPDPRRSSAKRAFAIDPLSCFLKKLDVNVGSDHRNVPLMDVWNELIQKNS